MNALWDELKLTIHAVWTRRWLALGVAWAIAVLGWLVVSQISNRYESRARVLVQAQSLLQTKVGITPGDQQRGIDAVRQTLTSQSNLEKVVRTTDLVNATAKPKDVSDRAIALQNDIKVTAQADNLYEISATLPKPKLAHDVVQRLIDLFIEQNLTGNRDETSQSLKFLDVQLGERQKQLQDADAKRADFQNRYLGSLPGTGTLQDRVSAARTQLAQVDGDLSAAQSSLAAVNGQMAGTTPTVAGAAGAAATAGPARARLNAIQGQLAEVRARGFTDAHPDVIALKSQLAQAQAAATKEPLVGGGASAAQANPLYLSLKSMQADKAAAVAALTQRRAALQRDLDQISAKLTGNPAAAAEQGEIERNYQVLKDQYDKLLADREEIRLRGQAQTQTDSVKFAVMDPPSQSRVPSAPNRPLLLTGVLLAALVGGVGAAVGLAQLRVTYPTAARLATATGLPVIGSISEVVGAIDAARRKRLRTAFAGGLGALGVAWLGLLGVEMLMRGLTT